MPEGARCLVALSGGGDSVALLHLLRPLREVQVAHLDHMLRPESAGDRRFVRELARSLAVPVHTARADVAACARRRGLSREEAGRRLRYRFLQEVRRRTGCALVLTAHTADDQAETVLLRVLAGTGLAGLGGIRPLRRDGVARPLLPFTREELRGWLTERGLPWREDATNLVPEAPRTRVRLLLMPLLRGWNPRVDRALARLARAAREDEAHLAREARQHLEEHGLEIAALAGLSPALRGRVLRLAAGPGLEERHLRALEGLLEGPSGRELWLPGGRVARRSRGALSFQEPQPGRPEPVTLPPAPFDLELPGWGIRLSGREGWAPPSEWSVALDLPPGPLLLRGRRPGDRFRGPGGTAPLKKFLHGRGVPRWERDRVPLLEAGGRVVWVLGHRADPEFLAPPGAARALLLEARPLDRSAPPPGEAPVP